ncbi:hypothetical protein GCM10009665_16760 [Kitasatospora nipponensis]|uniref:DUF2207 domain-containing protein n=1 Tax=Kitasatospora nipponensis TaxID=258049 RepID=A0ABP4GJF8_9ACTN
MALFLLVVILAILLGIIGVAVHGLFYLLVIGIVLLIADLVFVGVRASRRRGAQR